MGATVRRESIARLAREDGIADYVREEMNAHMPPSTSVMPYKLIKCLVADHPEFSWEDQTSLSRVT
jgi:hypothetical protein